MTKKSNHPMPANAFTACTASMTKPCQSLLSLAILTILATQAHASLVRDDIDYQYFRDFAENKGQFSVGASNITIYNKNGQAVGTMLNGVPMVDFAPISTNGVATLADNQYILSVAHNGGYQSVQFGAKGNDYDPHKYTYQLVDNNNYTKDEGHNYATDYHLPRLHKLVTEVAPATTNHSLAKSQYSKNEQNYPQFVRAGSGTQKSELSNGKGRKNVADAYQFLTGGTALKIDDNRHTWLDGGGGVIDNKYGPMPTVGLPGDSGSGIFVYDKAKKQWILTGTLNALSDHGQGRYANTWSLSRPDYNEEVISGDTITVGRNKIDSNKTNAVYHWVDSGNGMATLSGGRLKNSFYTPIYKPALKRNANSKISHQIQPDINYGKSLVFADNAAFVSDNSTNTKPELYLDSPINQGAGALIFQSDFVVKGADNATWLGAGVNVAKDKTVHWQIKNPAGDRLSKIGQGTLIVDGTGAGEGQISIGDGMVILSQKADNAGKQQAFTKVGIVSGRPTVVLGDDKQIGFDDIYFGYRGGRLDLNGNNMHAKTINHNDDGATIVNNKGTATLTLTGDTAIGEKDLVWGEWSKKGGDIYEYINTHKNNRKDYFLLKKSPHGYYPTDQNSNDNWQFLGSGEDGKRQAIDTVLKQKNAPSTSVFLGYLGQKDNTTKNNSTKNTNATLNINYQPHIKDSSLLLSGGMSVADFALTNGKVILSGRPTPHAYDFLTKKEVIKDDDWQSRDFIANNISVNHGQLYVGRGVNHLTSNILAGADSYVDLGLIAGTTPICQTSDQTHVVDCRTELSKDANLAQQIASKLPKLTYQGDINLQDNARLEMDNIHATTSLHGQSSTTTTLHKNAHITLTKDSQLGKLIMQKGAQIDLNRLYDTPKDTAAFNTLTVQSFEGNGQINHLADFATMQGDKVVVEGKASGELTLAVKSTGKEPVQSKDGLELVHVNADNAKDLNVKLQGGGVDLGAYHYQLINDGNGYRLHNRVVEAKLAKTQSTQPKTQTQINAPIEVPSHHEKLQDDQMASAQVIQGAQIEGDAQKNAHSQSERTTHQSSTDINDGPFLTILATAEQPQVQVIQTDAPIEEVLSRYSKMALAQEALQGHGIQLAQIMQNDQIDDETKGVFASISTDKSNHKAYQSDTSAVHSTMQMGANFALSDDLTVGAALSRLKTDGAVNGVGNINTTTKSASAYAKKQFGKMQQSFVALNIDYAHSNNKLTLDDKDSTNARTSVGIGANVGHRINIGNNDSTTLNATLGASAKRLNANDYMLHDAHITSKAQTLAGYRAKIAVQHKMSFGKVQVSPSVFMHYHRTTPIALAVNDWDFKNSTHRDTALGIDLGMRYKNLGINMQAKHGFGAQKTKSAHLSLHWVW